MWSFVNAFQRSVMWHHTQHNDDTHHNDAQYNDIQHNNEKYIIQHNDTQHNDNLCLCRVSLRWESFMLSVTNNIIMLNVVMLSVVMLNVVAPVMLGSLVKNQSLLCIKSIFGNYKCLWACLVWCQNWIKPQICWAVNVSKLFSSPLTLSIY